MNVTIRTITLGIGEPHPISQLIVEQAAAFLQKTRKTLEAAGYVVQTTRIATRPLLEDIGASDQSMLVGYAKQLQNSCDQLDLSALSLGPVPADDPAFPLERVGLLPDLLGPYPALHGSVQVASIANGINYPATLAAAHAMHTLATFEQGAANFRFAALAVCEPGGAFFPQAYHRAPKWGVSLGLQSAGLVRQSIESLAAQAGSGMPTLAELRAVVGTSLSTAAEPIVTTVSSLANAAGFEFLGIDLSPAPMGDESIAAAIEAVGFGPLGTPGTLAVVAALTGAIQSTSLPTCGYCGLMLPVLEDTILGLRCAEGRLSIATLLTFSAVCGTGLDTVPIPGDTTPEQVAALIADVATLAFRLRKPLSARLFLVPEGKAGEMTNFTSPYLTNTRILAL